MIRERIEAWRQVAGRLPSPELPGQPQGWPELYSTGTQDNQAAGHPKAGAAEPPAQCSPDGRARGTVPELHLEG